MKRVMSCKARLSWLICLLGMFLLCSPWQAQAAGTVPVSIQYICGNTKYPTTVQAENCFYQAWICAYRKTSCGFNQWTWVELSNVLNGYVPFSPICGYGHVLPVVLSKLLTCPEHSTGSTTCTCDSGYKPDPTNTLCVSECPIEDLPAITDADVQTFENNPNHSDINRLTPEMQTSLQCLRNAATDMGGTSSVGSAYRPPAYNQHLIQLWGKWVNELRDNTTPSCLDLKNRIQEHFNKHHLLESQSPAPNSRHTQGLAVDVTINLSAHDIDALASGCGLYRPLPVTDRVHFQFP